MSAETILVELADATRERYLRYAVSVITSRALPDVRDGLKPVQRRILYAMGQDLRLRPEGRSMKSAGVVGRVMGDYHPHGNQAIYDAMVRMAQPFVLRYPLVHGEGNFGAITGDGAAAERYTEAKLLPLGMSFLETIEEETVELRPTYDDRNQEPVVLPATAPFLLLNGASGIAVGLATNIPPHNLKETLKACVALIDKPDTSVAQLFRSFRGPDFPTGGQILATRDELREIYEKGQGSIQVRGTYRIEEGSKERARQRVIPVYAVIESIPYGTTTAAIAARIGELIDKKKLPGVVDVSDQTSKEEARKGLVRVVLELEREADPTTIMAAVYRLTPLQLAYGINLTCLVPGPDGGVPFPRRHASLTELLRAWLDFRFQTYTRALEYRKRKLDERIHILEGYLKVLENIDKAVKVVREAKDRADARDKLMKRFALDEPQASAVLELQLYRLAQLELGKLQDELQEKQKESRRLAKLLSKDELRWADIRAELEALAEQHGDKRRTEIVGADEEHAFDPLDLIKREDTHVIISREGRIKRVRQLGELDKLRVREGDALLSIVQGSTVACVCFLTNKGACYTLRVNDVPATAGFGEPIQAFFNFADGERIIGSFSTDPRLLIDRGAGLVVGVSSGHVVRVPLEPYLEPSTKAGRKFAALRKGEEAVGADVPEPDHQHVLLATSRGNALRAPLAEVPVTQGVARGKQALKLDKKKQEVLIGLTTRPVLRVETTRGGEYRLDAKKLSLGELGGKPEEVMSRFGFKAAVPPDPVVYELPSQGEEG
ncbi:MAG: DNA topoisomerase (ATP-hydrolyzing) subunit A [Planctomycetota bacterium]